VLNIYTTYLNFFGRRERGRKVQHYDAGKEKEEE
jgi:hypothetical protein